ncbi:hypothetical protein PP175_17165 [Aneurinibacillus sp. Ricciae_BoGa-3]|uniref:hypothetical protein n=1 Tax=Aneurinibacillus sp. Ricciae_BoGa-3 TaxID=3022697 RepID=UPI00233F9AF3|nr:hypothetical protein [Aneurinibacillus sp. Ricciae_BoGa-3]WCK53129.1 hypothetical protein PP175_17165 [Aneurinibacillus sp. Ricciae_BoGa-3]
MELVYIVIFSLLVLILLFGTCYMLAVVVNKINEHSDWFLPGESIMAREESAHTETDDR